MKSVLAGGGIYKHGQAMDGAEFIVDGANYEFVNFQRSKSIVLFHFIISYFMITNIFPFIVLFFVFPITASASSIAVCCYSF